MRLGVVAILAGVSLTASLAVAQVPFPFRSGVVGGVYVEPDGALKQRQQDEKELAALRALAKDKNALHSRIAARQGPVTCVSLPRVFAAAKAALAANQPLPEDVRYLGGLTQVRYVFVFPEEKDLVIAGPADTFNAQAQPAQPIGKTSGRPVLQIEDLVVALRATGGLRQGSFIGCTIDPPANAVSVTNQVVAKYQSGSRDRLKAELAKAVGPQTISVFGVPGDSRMALALVAADYKLKMLCTNIEPSPIPGLGHVVDKAGAPRLWFELAYEPLAVTADSTAYEFRGPRLKVLAGASMLDTRGATESAKKFVAFFSEHMDEFAAVLPAIADLQNVADMTCLAALIRQDKLDARAGWDTAWIHDAKTFPVAALNVPKTTPTQAMIVKDAIVAGGVALTPASIVGGKQRSVLTVEKRRPGENAWVVGPTK